MPTSLESVGIPFARPLDQLRIPLELPPPILVLKVEVERVPPIPTAGSGARTRWMFSMLWPSLSLARAASRPSISPISTAPEWSSELSARSYESSPGRPRLVAIRIRAVGTLRSSATCSTAFSAQSSPCLALRIPRRRSWKTCYDIPTARSATSAAAPVSPREPRLRLGRQTAGTRPGRRQPGPGIIARKETASSSSRAFSGSS